jgi:hypothetical protein
MKTIDLYMKRTERKEEKKFRMGLFFSPKMLVYELYILYSLDFRLLT